MKGGVRAALALALAPALARAQDDGAPYVFEVQEASDEGRRALEAFRVPEGMRAELFAAEPMLANPVALYVAHDGRVFVAETFRHYEGVTDIRDHMDWLHDDLASRRVADRVAMFRKHEGERFVDYERASERIRLIEDEDGDGVADTAVVFADGFDDPAAGIGAGVLENHGDVYYTCIPDLWLLRDHDGDGRADERQKLSTGYGVHVALLGHDLHGLRIGPDGKLYFSCGDRAFNVATERGVIVHTASGAVLRCDLDGTNLEVVHGGLRNPQELVFDEHGNLFTGDNNSDGGDEARWVSIVEGGDSGWRYSYQWLTEPNLRGPWNDERLWWPRFDGQAAYLVPPIANLASGPSGLTHDPGTGLPPEYAGHFFLCDFRGNPSYSGIHAFTTLPKGAFWELGEVRPYVWNTLATDADFGPDGWLYFCDWVSGWSKTGKGRVYRVADPELAGSALVLETRALLAGGVAGLGLDELEELLAHADQRVRQEAQFELVRRDAEGANVLRRTAQVSASPLARLHGIWGLGMVARRAPERLEVLVPLSADADPEVRAQALRVLGDARFEGAKAAVARAIDDAAPRVRFFAAIAAAKVCGAEAFAPLCRALVDAGESDPNLRHAAVMGLLGSGGEEAALRAAERPELAVRTGALLVLRRLRSPAAARFLAPENEPSLVVEAARAIHDVPIAEAMPALADLLAGLESTETALVRRVLNANYRLGGEERARALARFATRADAETAHRVEALAMLAEWTDPPPLDRVMGHWDPLPPRDGEFLASLPALAADGVEEAPDDVRRAFVALVVASEDRSSLPRLARWITDGLGAGRVRAQALEALETLDWPELLPLVDAALGDADGVVRATALELLERRAPAEVLARLPAILANGELAERRVAYGLLATNDDARARTLLLHELELLSSDLVPAELALDLVRAAEARNDPALDDLLAARRARRDPDPELAPWLDTLFGGDRDRGHTVFERVDLSCVRCHAIRPERGLRVGPNLERVGERLSRLQLLESLVAPNRRTTPGYQATVFFLADGSVVSGRLLEESEGRVSVQDADGALIELSADEITERRADLSAMPEDLAKDVSLEEMRDLIAYLAEL